MKTLLIALLTLAVGSTLLLPDSAEAKRFGGGRSMGQQYTAPRPATPAQAAPQTRPQATPAGAPGARSGASRWLGPLAGLAAGGLLAAMLFGDGFQGMQIMDFIVIALLVFGGFMLFRMLRQRAAAQRPAALAAGAAPYAGAYGRDAAAGVRPDPLHGHGGGQGAPVWGQQPVNEAPTWFDGAAFAEGAKGHFMRLQDAWDRNDMAEIQTYTSPALFAELRQERAALGAGPNVTEVVRLDAVLSAVRRDGDQVIASVHFTGLVREDPSAPANSIEETWHVAHPWGSPVGDWLIVGIQQAG